MKNYYKGDIDNLNDASILFHKLATNFDTKKIHKKSPEMLEAMTGLYKAIWLSYNLSNNKILNALNTIYKFNHKSNH